MLKLLLGDPNTRKLKRYQPLVEEINFLEEEISKLTDDELRKETHNLKSTISSELDIKKQKSLLDEFLPKAFAIVREASKRVLDMRHFDVQLIGGMVLHECQIAEMKTGEGKTLVATLPCFLKLVSEEILELNLLVSILNSSSVSADISSSKKFISSTNG